MFKRIIFLILIIGFWGCTKDELPPNCLRPFSVQLAVNLNLPQFNSLVIGNAAELSGGAKGILIFRKKIDEYVAFDRICPVNDCDTPMIYENRLLKCICDNSSYSLDFGGAPQTEDFVCPAIEYRAIYRGSELRITNF